MAERIYYHPVNNLTPTVAEPMNGKSLKGLPFIAYDLDCRAGTWKCDKHASEWFLWQDVDYDEGTAADLRRRHFDAIKEHVELRIQFFYLKMALVHGIPLDFRGNAAQLQGGQATCFPPKGVKGGGPTVRREAAHSSTFSLCGRDVDSFKPRLPYLRRADVTRVLASTVTVPIAANTLDSKIDGNHQPAAECCEKPLRPYANKLLNGACLKQDSLENLIRSFVNHLHDCAMELWAGASASGELVAGEIASVYISVCERARETLDEEPDYFGQLLMCRCDGTDAQRRAIHRHAEYAYRKRQIRLHELGELVGTFVQNRFNKSERRYFKHPWFHGAFVDAVLTSPEIDSATARRLKLYWNYRGPQATWLPVVDVYDRDYLPPGRPGAHRYGHYTPVLEPDPDHADAPVAVPGPAADLVPLVKIRPPNPGGDAQLWHPFKCSPTSGEDWSILLAALSEHMEKVRRENASHEAMTKLLLAEQYGVATAHWVEQAYRGHEQGGIAFFDTGDDGVPRLVFPVDPYIFQLHVV